MEYSVLIVESDNKIQADLNEVLKTHFNIQRIITADSRESAQNELDSHDAIHCIFINSEIIGNNSYDFVTKLKENNKHKNTAVLLLSEDNSREALLQAAASGVNELIPTPISTRHLSLKLKRVFKTKAFRTVKRVSVMGALDAILRFDSENAYSGKLIDISSGGCSIRSPLLSHGGGVYDNVQIVIEHGAKSVAFPAELVRIEKDPESDINNQKDLLLAFQIKNLSEDKSSGLNSLIESLTNQNT